MQVVRVFVEENNLAVFDDQLLVNGCKYPDVPRFKGSFVATLTINWQKGSQLNKIGAVLRWCYQYISNSIN